MTNETNTTISNSEWTITTIDITSNTEYYPFMILTVGFPLYAYYTQDNTMLSFGFIISILATVVSITSGANMVFNLIHILLTALMIVGLMNKT